MRGLIKKLSECGLLVQMPQQEIDTLDVSYITTDSRAVKPGTLFVCKGFAFKEEYLFSAVEKGASVYLSEREYGTDIPCILVTDVRRASSVAARWFFKAPGDELFLTGITGTKGKTTTAYIMKAILDTYRSHDTAIFSTMEIDTVKERKETHLTTPEPVDLQSYFLEVKDFGARHVVMEVSSQAMKMGRVYGQEFDIGIFLNIGEDHIGGREHATMEEYVDCKTSFLSQCRTVIINQGTDYLDKALDASEGKKRILYGYGEDCDVIIRKFVSDVNGSRFEIEYQGNRYAFETSLFGDFNAENLTAAIIAAFEMGIDAAAIQEGIRFLHIPGRMHLMEKNGIHIVIDYAHNYLSFKRLYEAVRESFNPKRIFSVFGCPGERSAVRKRDMGMLAQAYADRVYLTMDDPGYEDVVEICRQMKAYITKPCIIIPDREEAVLTALAQAESGDVVILAGKGAEVTQRYRDGFLPYLSDQKVVEKWMATM